MEKQEIGRFYAKTFDGVTIEFIVFDNNTIDCPTLEIYNINLMELKPRFNLWGEEGFYSYDVPASYSITNSKLIGNYDIEPELFDYLKQNQMIIYSNDMAYLYGFEDKKGFDSEPRHYGVGSPFKWAKKKGPILVKQKKGQFN